MFRKTFMKRAWVYTKGKMETYTGRHTKRKPLSPKFYVKNIELLPIMTICILDFFMVAYCSVRTFLSTDLKYAKHIKNRGEDIELLKNPRCLKFYCPTQEYVPNMELYNLYQEMNGVSPGEEEPEPKDMTKDTASSKESSRRSQDITKTDNEDIVKGKDSKASSGKCSRRIAHYSSTVVKTESDSQVETKEDSRSGSLPLKEIKQKLVINNDEIQSPETLFGKLKNTKQQIKKYSEDKIHTTLRTTEMTYSKGHKVVEDETSIIEFKNGKNPMFQKVITIVHPSGESDIAMKKFYIEKNGTNVEIKEDEWTKAYPTTIPQNFKPDHHQRRTIQIESKRRTEEDKITENITGTETFETGVKRIREETIVKDTKDTNPPKVVAVKYYLEMGGTRINIDEDSWKDTDIIPQMPNSSVTIDTETIPEADGKKMIRTITTTTEPNGDKHSVIDTTIIDKSGNKSIRTEHSIEKKSEKRSSDH